MTSRGESEASVEDRASPVSLPGCRSPRSSPGTAERASASRTAWGRLIGLWPTGDGLLCSCLQAAALVMPAD
ncbi:uncharacterized protein N7482_004858 [Penicillium canariense]|uniref:Uncharacterized protein n=1 Tax=Penicillium canariense TaxID=189055 RepID=A0A9W9I9G6_9EURO|nr:uncharacterized protein N7482_004858 [Penicillium canariense]KAJ5169264.1 hypothetical protein N7482_004858 [Penicillium canariense]